MPKISCHFCQRSKPAVKRFFKGNKAYICDECIRLCHEILDDEQEFSAPRTFAVPKPSDIKAFLDEYVVDQERAKTVISVAVYNHYRRIMVKDNDVELQKSNILLVGPTGTGKTLIAETLARLLHVPFSIADATPLTEAGYVGEDVENILLRLIQAADFNIPRAEIGIIYLDEIDKIARKSDSPSITRDVSGEGVQQALLKILEGTIASVPPHGGRKHPEQEYLRINTRHILFILGGTFTGIENTIAARLNRNQIGFINEQPTRQNLLNEVLPYIEADDLVKYGLIPEFVGRVPVTAPLIKLSQAALVDILTTPRNSLIKQYAKYFMLEGIKLEFTDDALSAIAQQAMQLNTGARALRSVMERFMLDIMFKIPGIRDIDTCVITEEVVMDGAEPQYTKKTKRRAQ